MAGGPVRQPYAGVTFSPQSGIYEFGYSFLEIGLARRLYHVFFEWEEGAQYSEIVYLLLYWNIFNFFYLI